MPPRKSAGVHTRAMSRRWAAADTARAHTSLTAATVILRALRGRRAGHHASAWESAQAAAHKTGVQGTHDRAPATEGAQTEACRQHSVIAGCCRWAENAGASQRNFQLSDYETRGGGSSPVGGTAAVASVAAIAVMSCCRRAVCFAGTSELLMGSGEAADNAMCSPSGQLSSTL